MLLLLAKTGRRVMEILQLDFDPLLLLAGAVSGTTPTDPSPSCGASRPRSKAPDTILVDRETVAIIEAQQLWAREWLDSESIDAASISAGFCFSITGEADGVANWRGSQLS